MVNYDAYSNQVAWCDKKLLKGRSVRTSTELAPRGGYSTNAFAIKLKDEFGEHPDDWMQKHRRYVKGKLLQSEIPSKSIADEFNVSS
ncbi:MAG: hypothetical protein RSF93_04550 [Mucinivorans sp.]